MSMIRPGSLVVVWVGCVVLGCETQEQPVSPKGDGSTQPLALPTAEVPASSSSAENPEEVAKKVVLEAGKSFGGALKARVQEGMAAGGPPAAIPVCESDAPRIALEMAQKYGVTLGRSSLRLRNPANIGPAWVGAWLAAQGERPVEGLSPEVQVVDGPNGKVARALIPIGVEAPCIACHGPADTLAEPVKAALQQRYPADKATGYAPGDLRGVLWVEKAIGG